MESKNAEQVPTTEPSPDAQHSPLHVPLIIIGGFTVVLGVLQFALDVLKLPSDPLLADGFRLALGSLVATVAADRVIVSHMSKGANQ